MRIAEISSPELRQAKQDTEAENVSSFLPQLESTIKLIEALSPDQPIPETHTYHLRETLTHLSKLTPFPTNSFKLHLWKLSFRLWNACVDLSNTVFIHRSSSSAVSSTENIASMRHLAADMLYLAGDVSGVPSPAIKSAQLYYKTGLLWHDIKKFDLASTCFERATDLVSKLDIANVWDAGERKLFLDLNLARSRTAWEVSDRNLTVTLLSRAKTLVFGLPEHYKSLAEQYLVFGKSFLSTNESSSYGDALRLMNEALDLCESGFNSAKKREDILELKGLRSKTLRFISAVHLQRGEYESVIKCVKVLRDGDGGVQHPSLSVLAMKAWLGLGRYSEAEKELRGMVVNKDIPEAVWVSAVEAYFEAAGTAGAETAKGVFLGLLGRCHVSANAAVRVAHRVLGDNCGEGSKIRAKVVAELASDERIVALFAGEGEAKARKAMHAVLWNCASDHFHSKDYETGAEMFEKSMLYIPFDIESRILRAKGYRVLCLCYLALSQLDRALEYINEAEKLEPNIACAFLKFKIYLQKSDLSGAINQITAMTTCLDFTPDFLSLSAHEAVACHALPVAVASLSKFLNFYTSGKPMPITEAVVLRTLVTILTQDPGNEPKALKFLKQTHLKASKFGPDCFFGEGEVGRREMKWFAVSSWNLGTKCGKEKNYDSCAEFFRLAAEFYSLNTFDEQETENTVMVCKSLILSVSAMIAFENQKKTALTDSEVKTAAELLDKAGKMLNMTSTGTGLIDNKVTTIEPDMFYMYTFTAYDIQGRLNNSRSQQQLVKSFASSKTCRPEYLLQFGLSASQGSGSNPEVATFALNECLSLFLSSSSPNYQTVALIIRKLIAVASVHKGDTDDDAVHSMYKQAYRIMVGLKEKEYPIEEGKWLAMTAWNRASLPVRLGQIDMAKKWMTLGLEIASKVVGMDTYRSCMEDYIAGFEKKSSLQNG